MTQFDLIIRGGHVIDGTGAARTRTDVGITGDRIVAVGDLRDAQSARTVGAAGRIVCPGFIDVHTHSDGWLLKTPHLTAKTTQGFTTEVLMADGISYAPVNEHTAHEWIYYLRGLDGLRMDEYRGWQSIADFMSHIDGRCAQNAISHVPYANVRSLVCGWGRGPIDDYQMGSIQNEIRKAMHDGAVGLSTGLDYIVQCFSTTDELVEACRAAAEFDGLYVTHIRYKHGLLNALREAVEIGKRAGIKVHISHLKGMTKQVADEVLSYIDNVARHEVDFSFDVYPYLPGSSMLNVYLPYEVWEQGPLAVAQHLGSKSMRERIRQRLRSTTVDLQSVRLAWTPGKENAVHQGKTLFEYVKSSGKPLEDAIADLLLEERLGVLMVVGSGDDRQVTPFLQHDLYMMGSDGIFTLDGPIHPRMYGAATRLIGPCVRDWKAFSLEDAIAKLTSKPAARFGLTDRGIIRDGAFADLVIFDAETVSDRAACENPRETSTGIEWVLVNGNPIIEHGTPIDQPSEDLPGRALRFRG